MAIAAKTEVMIIRETVAASIAKDAGTLAMFGALIGIGVLLDSGAMQWVGAVIGFFWIVTLSFRASVKNRLTIEQARVRLDEIEAGR